MRIIIFSKQRMLTISILLAAGVLLLLCAWQIETTPSLIRTPGTFYMVITSDKVVALTFDDGPDPAFTIPILDILKKEQVRASFFVLGQNAKDYPAILARMIKEGHEIGNHSYSHDYSQRKLLDEIKKTDQAVFNATKIHTYFYRPPGGSVSKSQLDILKTNGHVVTLWSLDSRDWLNQGSKRIASNVIQGVFPGAIILMHDGGDKREQTVNALAKIISELRSQGYNFVTVSELRLMAATAN